MSARPAPSRHVAPSVVRRVFAEHRGRCCLCRTLIDPLSSDPLSFTENLEKHHLVFVSEGGDSTFENLILVCPTCHARVHAHPDSHPVELLRKRREHWIGMKQVVPEHLALRADPGGPPESLHPAGGGALQATLRLVSLGLQFTIEIPGQSHVPASELAEFVHQRIILPLAEYDQNRHWLGADSVRLAHQSSLSEIIDAERGVKDELRTDDPFVPILGVRVHLAAVGPGPRPRRLGAMRAAFRRLRELRRTTKGLAPSDGSVWPPDWAALRDPWETMLADPSGRAWMKKAALALAASPDWDRALDGIRQYIHSPQASQAAVGRYFAERREELSRLYSAVVGQGCAPPPDASYSNTLWSLIVRLLLAVETATVESVIAGDW